MNKVHYLFYFFLLLNVVISAHATFSDPFNTDPLTSNNPQTIFSTKTDIRVPNNTVTIHLPKKPLTLAEITDFALRNNPATSLAWSQAKFAAASLGVAKSAYWPQLNADVTANHGSDLFTTTSNTQNTYGANISLSYLLLDFGNRANQVRIARYNLIAANLNQNSQIQQVILQTQQAYYQVLGQQALVQANQKSVTEAETSLKAAQALRKYGMATVGDFYQSQASLAQTNLNLEQAKGNYQIALGQLATTIGLPANVTLQLIPLSAIPPIHPIKQNVATLMAQAKLQRPDLLAAEAQVRASQAQLAATKAAVLPTLQLNGNTKPQFDNGANNANAQITLSISMPLFTGYAHTYQVKQAKEQINTATATRNQLNDQVQLQVWQAYAALNVAENSIGNTGILLKSSQQAVQLALGQYKAGVGNILTVLTTQSSLANARVQSIQARLNWYIALAQLVQAVGMV